MTKIGPNQPCPCGSGKKYKRCCRDRDRAEQAREGGANSSPSPDPATPEAQPADVDPVPDPALWRGFNRGRPVERFVDDAALADLVTPAQARYLLKMSELALAGRPDCAEQGLGMLEALPDFARRFFAKVLEFELLYLAALGRHDEIGPLLKAHLPTMTTELHWVRRGRVYLEWMVDKGADEDRAWLARSLRTYVAANDLVVPRVALAELAMLKGGEARDEAFELYRTILVPERWPAGTALVAEWLGLAAVGMLRLLGELLARGDEEGARKLGRAVPRFPWDQRSTLRSEHCDPLCQLLDRLELDRELRKLCERMGRRFQNWGGRHYWLGRIAQRQAKPKAVFSHFRAALKAEELAPGQRLTMVSELVERGPLDEARAALDLFPDQESADYLELESEYRLRAGDLQGALELNDQLLAARPADIPARMGRVSILFKLQRFAEAVEILTALQRGASGAILDYTLVWLGLAHTYVGEPGQALEQLDRVLRRIESRDGAQLGERYSVLVHMADCLVQLERTDEAIDCYRRALDLVSAEVTYYTLAMLLLDLERDAEADAVTAEAVARYPESTLIRYVRALSTERAGRWEELLDLTGKIELDWMEQRGELARGIVLRCMALAGAHGSLQALEFLDSQLHTVVADEGLRYFREQTFAAVKQDFRALQEETERQQDDVQRQLAEARQILAQQRRARQQSERAYQRTLRLQEQLQREVMDLRKGVARQEGQTALASLEQSHPELTAALPSQSRALLAGAELLWRKLESHADADHGPVVLQLARVVEAEVNRSLVDPLVAHSVAVRTGFDALPTPTVGALRQRANRLSLNDAMALLYERWETRETDGTITTTVNPRSNQQHKQVIRSFWEQSRFSELAAEQRAFLMGDLPAVLLQLGRLRNQAGHAGEPIPRSTAAEVRSLILGSAPEPGLLMKLAAAGTTPGPQ